MKAILALRINKQNTWKSEDEVEDKANWVTELSCTCVYECTTRRIVKTVNRVVVMCTELNTNYLATNTNCEKR